MLGDDPCPHCSHSWHGLPCDQRGRYTDAGGLCRCPGAYVEPGSPGAVNSLAGARAAGAR